MTHKNDVSVEPGGTVVFTGDGVEVYRAQIIAQSLALYAKTKMKTHRMFRVRDALAYVEQKTGRKFKRTEMLEAAEALKQWARDFARTIHQVNAIKDLEREMTRAQKKD